MKFVRVLRRLRLVFTAGLITVVVLATALVIAGGTTTAKDTEDDLVAIDRPYGLWTRNALEDVRQRQIEPIQFFDTGDVIALTPQALAVSARAAQFTGPEAQAKYGIPALAISAYKLAALRQSKAKPGCNLPWTLLAGIGRVESDHGRFGNSAVTEGGLVKPKIIGIPLNGVGPVAAIPDSDGGLLDGDKLWDRAVGPMQFIPTTWATSGRDGNGDGIADPHNMIDAAFSAAGYLCPAVGSLSDVSNLRAAVFSYNHSDSYVDLVLAYERAYRTGVFTLPDPTPGPPTGLPDSPYGEPGDEKPGLPGDGKKNDGKNNGPKNNGTKGDAKQDGGKQNGGSVSPPKPEGPSGSTGGNGSGGGNGGGGSGGGKNNPPPKPPEPEYDNITGTITDYRPGMVEIDNIQYRYDGPFAEGDLNGQRVTAIVERGTNFAKAIYPAQ